MNKSDIIKAAESVEPVQEHFALTYANYQVVPRSIAQSIPQEWQQRFAKLMLEIDEACYDNDISTLDYKIFAYDENGKRISDPYRDYQRGRRNVFKELKCTN